MIKSMQGWLLIPFRLAIAVGIAYLISSGINQPNQKLDLAFLSKPTQEEISKTKPTLPPPAASSSPLSLSNKIGISASAALVLYVWVAYEWVGFARFTKACQRLKTLGARLQFKADSEQPVYHYCFRAETTVDLNRKQLRAEHFDLLKQLPNVTNLSLENAKVPNNFVSLLGRLKRLRKINVQGIPLSDTQRQKLAKILAAR